MSKHELAINLIQELVNDTYEEITDIYYNHEKKYPGVPLGARGQMTVDQCNREIAELKESIKVLEAADEA